jgi:hypothetical protein
MHVCHIVRYGDVVLPLDFKENVVLSIAFMKTNHVLQIDDPDHQQLSRSFNCTSIRHSEAEN